MQRIERYGVIALVFLLVTILAVSLWGEGQAKDVLARVKDKAANLTGLATAPASGPSGQAQPTGRRGKGRSLPITGQSESTPRKRNNGRKGGLRGEESLEDAFVVLEPSRTQEPVTRAIPTPGPRVRTPAEQQAAYQPVAPKPVTHAQRSPVAPVAPGRQATQTARTYVVRSGDTMSQIAQRELGTYKRWNEIQSLNGGLDPAKLRVGMKIKLPGAGAAARATPVQQPQPQRVASAKPTAKGGSYSVRKGDSLSVIAQRELGTSKRWQEIVALNPGLDPNRLAVGAKLVMPAGQSLPVVRTQQVAALTPSERSGSTGRVR